jgi:hypothetical protein
MEKENIIFLMEALKPVSGKMEKELNGLLKKKNDIYILQYFLY